MEKKTGGWGPWVNVGTLVVSVFALWLAASAHYKTTFKPFSLRLWTSPFVQLQHKANLGLYVFVAFRNESPTSGLLTNMVLVLNRQDAPANRYLLQLVGLPELGPDLVYRDSFLRLPIFLPAWEWQGCMTNFVYIRPEAFPIQTGTYEAEILVMTDFEDRARYSGKTSFEVSADMISEYMAARASGSTRLQDAGPIGARPQESRPLALDEYRALKQ